MSELQDDILKDEEIKGGFNPGEPDDDTFSLKGKNYEGNLEKFIQTPTIEENIVNENSTEDDTLVDPDLSAFVQGLQSVSKRKSKNKDNSENNFDDIDYKLFEPIGDENADTNFVISDLDIDKPSTATIGERQISDEDKNISKAKIDNLNNNNNIDEIINEEEKKKRIPILKWLSVAAILLLFIGAGAYFFFNQAENDKISNKNKITSDTLKLNKKDKAEKNKELKEIDTNKEAEKIVDTLITSKMENAGKEKTAEKDISKNEINNISQKSDNKIEKPDMPLDVNKSNKDLVNKLKEIDEKVSGKKQNKENKEHFESKKLPEKLKNIDLATAKPVKPSELKSKAMAETFRPKNEKTTNFNDKPNDIQGVYIVQIYSSQSKEDAQLWLNKLTARNINDAFISEQKMRDKIWYRVRFGNFQTREEARQAALRLGFSQTWIDRVK